MTMRTYRLAGQGLGDTYAGLKGFMERHGTLRNSFSDKDTDWESHIYPCLVPMSGALKMEYRKHNESITVKIMSRFSDEATDKLLGELEKYGFELEEEREI